jgi:hypothetical protein
LSTFSALYAYICGLVSQELSLPFDTPSPEEAVAIAEAILEVYRTEAYPHLAELTIDRVVQPGYSYADEFEFGLDLILDSLDRLK